MIIYFVDWGESFTEQNIIVFLSKGRIRQWKFPLHQLH